MNISNWLHDSELFPELKYTDIDLYNLKNNDLDNFKKILHNIKIFKINTPYPIEIYLHLLNLNEDNKQLYKDYLFTYEDNFFYNFIKNPIKGALLHDNIELLIYLKENNYNFNEHIFEYASNLNNIRSILWLIDIKCPFDYSTIDNFLILGEINIIELLFQNNHIIRNIDEEYNIYDSLFINGNIDNLNWAFNKGYKLSQFNDTYYDIINSSHSEEHKIILIKWLDDHIEGTIITYKDYNTILDTDQLQIIKWCLDKKYIKINFKMLYTFILNYRSHKIFELCFNNCELTEENIKNLYNLAVGIYNNSIYPDYENLGYIIRILQK